MKLIIDIPDSAYKVCYDLRNVGDTNCLADILVNAVGVGTPMPDNATNGDVIKALFHDINYEEGYVYVKSNTLKNVIMTVREDWWNAPYQKGGK